EHVEEGVPHGAGADRVEREARSWPIAGAAQLPELVEDAGFVLVLPLPDARHQLLSADVVPGLAFLVADAALHHGLRGDAGVVRPRHIERVVALHAPPANQ